MLYFSLFLSLAFAQTERISTVNHNLAKVDKIYIAAGLVSVLEFPQNIIEVRVGDVSSVKVAISQVSPKEMTVYLSSSASKATNLIVRAEKKIYVFDIIPSKSNHQDYVKIRGNFGSPSMTSAFTNEKSVRIEPVQKKSANYKLISSNLEKVSP